MKRIAIALLALAAIGFVPVVTGCKTQSPPPAWAITAPERTVGDVIYSANSAVVKYETDKTAGMAYTANTKLKAVMRDIQKSLAVAQPAYNTWNAALKANPAAPEPANLAGAIATIQSLLGQLPSLTQ